MLTGLIRGVNLREDTLLVRVALNEHKREKGWSF